MSLFSYFVRFWFNLLLLTNFTILITYEKVYEPPSQQYRFQNASFFNVQKLSPFGFESNPFSICQSSSSV